MPSTQRIAMVFTPPLASVSSTWISPLRSSIVSSVRCPRSLSLYEHRAPIGSSAAQKIVDARLGAGLRIDGFDDHCAGQRRSAGRVTGHHDRMGRDMATDDLTRAPVHDLERLGDEHPIATMQPSPTITPSTISERAPMKQLSPMMVGLARSCSRTPPK